LWFGRAERRISGGRHFMGRLLMTGISLHLPVSGDFSFEARIDGE
jgi:hypothetical protein